MRRTIRQIRYRIRRATLISSCAAMACGEGLLDPPNPPSLPSIVFFSETFVQNGVSFTDPSLLVPDEAFEYHWVISGGGWVAVSVSGPFGLGAGANLLFDVPLACGIPSGVRVSSLPAGNGYGLYLSVGSGASGGPNPCTLPPVWFGQSWHSVDFSHLPVSATPLSDVTITRLVTP